MTTTTQHPEAFCNPAAMPFSVVVDDVDARVTDDGSHVLHKLLTDTTLELRKCTKYASTKEESDARIKQIQVEAESRKLEFARLLEEHAQVIRKLKQMEEDVGVGATNA